MGCPQTRLGLPVTVIRSPFVCGPVADAPGPYALTAPTPKISPAVRSATPSILIIFLQNFDFFRVNSATGIHPDRDLIEIICTPPLQGNISLTRARSTFVAVIRSQRAEPSTSAPKSQGAKSVAKAPRFPRRGKVRQGYTSHSGYTHLAIPTHGKKPWAIAAQGFPSGGTIRVRFKQI